MAFVCNEIPFVFVHVPKIAGTFLRKSFFPQCGLTGEEYGHWNNFSEFPIAASKEEISTHSGISYLPQKYKNLPVLVILRNPWEWYVSHYNYLYLCHDKHIWDTVAKKIPGPLPEYDNKLSFRESMHRLIGLEFQKNNLDVEFLHIFKEKRKHFKEMNALDIGWYSWWYVELLSELGFDNTSKIEDVFNNDKLYFVDIKNLKDGLYKFFLTLGYELDVNSINWTKINTSKQMDYRTQYDDDLAQLIRDRDQYIIEKFNFNF